MGIVQDASSVVHCRRMGIGAVTPIKYYLADKRSRCNEGKELIEGRPPAKELCKKVDQEICACVQNCGTTDLELVCAPFKTSFFWDVAEEQKSEWYEACDAIRQDKKAHRGQKEEAGREGCRHGGGQEAEGTEGLEEGADAQGEGGKEEGEGEEGEEEAEEEAATEEAAEEEAATEEEEQELRGRK